MRYVGAPFKLVFKKFWIWAKPVFVLRGRGCNRGKGFTFAFIYACTRILRMYACMHACMYTYTYRCVYVYTSKVKFYLVSISTCVSLSFCTCIYIYTHVSICTPALYLYIHLLVCFCLYSCVFLQVPVSKYLLLYPDL